MNKYTIGLDFGTLSGRGVLVRCSDGQIMATASKNYSHGVIDKYLNGVPLPPECCLQNPSDYIEVLDFVVPELLKQSKVNASDVIGLGIDFTSCTILPIDSQATPLCMKQEFENEKNAYVKLWKHHGAQKQADKINAILKKMPDQNAIRFGDQISSELMAPKVLEIIEESPLIYAKSDSILEAGDWLTLLLTKSNSRSCSMAGYKAWWDEEEGYPDSQFYESIDGRMTNFVQEKMRGDICQIGKKIGILSSDWATRLGLKSGIAISPCIIDSHAGFAGSGVCEKDQMLLVLGTSSVVIVLSEKPFSGKGVCGGVKNSIVPGFYAFESGVASVGDLFEWFIENCVPMKYYKEAEEKAINIHDLLSIKANELMPGQSGILALDWWNGNKTPFVDSNLNGVLLGLNLSTKPEDIYRALIEATAFGIRDIKEVYEENGILINHIIASGGITSKNHFLMQIYADILNTEIKISENEQAAACGSAIYAALAAGKSEGGYDDFHSAVKNMSKIKNESFLPNKKNVQIYNEIYKIYRKLSFVAGSKENDILHDLHNIKIKVQKI